ncbi:MAG: ATP-binding protein [Legionella sp.]|nr:hypothetical protein [Chlorobiaceae bacterium]MDP3268983.1 ATP-binding protein [Legionella sp.]
MKKYFKIDARAIIALGRNSIKDHTTALIELVKNSYDADADLIEIGIFNKLSKEKGLIRIADNGDGMSADEVENNWLRIGFSEKRNNPETKKSRKKTGEKGIGRLSADRLGTTLELRTCTDKSAVYGLKINWDAFDIEGKDLSKIPVNTIDKPEIKLPKKNERNVSQAGTELLITNLRQYWEEDDIKSLYEELSILTPPFEGYENDLNIVIETDVTDKYSGPVKSSFSGTAEIELQADFDKDGNLNYKVYERSSVKSEDSKNYTTIRSLSDQGVVLRRQLVQEVEQKYSPESKSAVQQSKLFQPDVGPLKVVLQFFPRKAALLEGTDFSMSDLREFLDINSGIKIYRDKIRVKPYGNPNDPEGDWLGLSERKTRNPAGAGRSDFRVNLNQIVGAVFLEASQNPNLIDSSSREGLIHDDEYNELKTLVLGCVILLETHYHNKFIQEKPPESVQHNVIENVRSLDLELKTLAEGLNKIKEDIPTSSNRVVQKQLDKITSVIASLKTTSKSIDELASQATIFRGLATLGIAATVFGHETQSYISGVTSSINTARRLLSKTPLNLESTVEEIDKSLDFSKKIASWGSFALKRVVKDKRKKQKTIISEVVKTVWSELKPPFEASSIDLHLDVEDVEGQIIAMDIESVLINILTNAYTACLQVNKNRKINLSVKKDARNNKEGCLIVVSDSGPGIAAKYLNRIWEPLFSTKIDKKGKQIGTGLGLMIVKSTIEELRGSVWVEQDEQLGGARFFVWIPL